MTPLIHLRPDPAAGLGPSFGLVDEAVMHSMGLSKILVLTQLYVEDQHTNLRRESRKATFVLSWQTLMHRMNNQMGLFRHRIQIVDPKMDQFWHVPGVSSYVQ